MRNELGKADSKDDFMEVGRWGGGVDAVEEGQTVFLATMNSNLDIMGTN